MIFLTCVISAIIPFTGAAATAAIAVSASSPEAILPLLESEAVQLTDEIISDLFTSDNAEVARLAENVAFANTTITTTPVRHKQRRSSNTTECKTYPGDLRWPSEKTWNTFDLLLGGALESYAPIGSVCYPNSTYNDYNAAKCEYITDNWSLGSVQYEFRAFTSSFDHSTLLITI